MDTLSLHLKIHWPAWPGVSGAMEGRSEPPSSNCINEIVYAEKHEQQAEASHI